MDARSRLVAGGIALAGTTLKDVATSPLEARAYAHPALPGRTVVRLTAEAIGDATDVEMAVLGFGAPSSKAVVGTSVLRSLGFPEWAVVNDPKHARFALEVMQEFRKSARKIKSKPGFARDELVAIAKRLERSVPHFLPSFWEEAGRAFSREESRAFAAQCFEKARTAESSFKLVVDEAQRSRAYLEFALAGSLSSKSLSGYAGDLVKAFGPKEGYARFFDLAVQRTRGGVPPWVGTTKELRALGKNAGVSASDVLRGLVLALIDAPSVARAPSDFWSDVRGELVALARQDAKVRARVRHLFPNPSNKYIVDEWISLLEEAGALDAFVLGHPDAPSEPHGATAKWASAFTLFVAKRNHNQKPSTTAVFPVLDKIAPRLCAEGVPVLLASQDSYWQSFEADVIEHALTLGVPLADVKKDDDGQDHAQLSLDHLTLDPVLLAAHPVFGPLIVAAVANEFGKPEFEKRATGKKGLAAARRLWLDERISKLETFALGALRIESRLLREKTTPATFAEFPEAAGRLATVNAEGALRRTLSAGLLDELGWPAFEAALAEHGKKQKKKEEKAGLFGTMSRPIILSGSTAIVFDGATPDKTITLPALGKSVRHMAWLGGALFVGYFDADYTLKGAWSTDWKDSFDEKGFPEHLVDFTLPDGSTTLGGRAIHAGDRTFGEAHPLITDGTTFWHKQPIGWREPPRIVELDPATGQKQRASWPAFVAPRTELDDGLRVSELELCPAPKGAERSPLGVKDGLLGFYARVKFPRQQNIGEVGRIDGLSWSGKGVPDALLSFPGSERPVGLHYGRNYGQDNDIKVLVTGGGVAHLTYGPDGGGDDEDDDFDEDDAPPGADEPKDPVLVPFSGFLRMPRGVWLHYLVPRDEAGSHALRKVSAETCKALLDAVREASGAPHAAAKNAVAKCLPEITNPHLRAGVARALEAALAGERRLAVVLAGGKDGSVAKGINDGDLSRVVPIRIGPSWGQGTVSPLIAASGRFLAGEKVGAFATSEHFFQSVLPHYGQALAFLVSRASIPKHREAVMALLRVFAESPYGAGMPLRLAELAIPDDAPIAKEKIPGRNWAFSEGASRYFVRCFTRESQTQSIGWVLEAFEGEPKLPKGTTLRSSAIVTAPDVRATLLEVLDLIATKGPVSFDVEDAKALSELSGMALPEAKLLLAGMPNLQEWAADFLGKELRTTLDLKVQDAKAAKVVFEEMPAARLAAILAGALDGVRASELWAHSTPGAPAKWVTAMARAIVSAASARVALRSELLVETRKIVGRAKKAELILEPLVNAEASSLRFVAGPMQAAAEDDIPSLDGALVESAAEVWSHLALALPVGDPYVAGIAAAVRVLRTSLLDDKTILPFAQCYLEEKPREAAFKRLGGKETKVEWKKDEILEGIDNGAIVAVQQSWRLLLALRTSAVARKDKAADVSLAEAIAVEAQVDTRVPAEVRFFLSDACEAWLVELDANRPSGRFAADPEVSAPKVLKKLAKALELDRDAARLYLELLALPAPTDAFICEINGWDKKALTKAKQELVGKKLVVEGKRERAGRDVFLPGGWEARSSGWALPVETWKLPLFGPSRATVRGSIGSVFERAAARVIDGDGPKFEEVAAVRKKKGKA